MKKKLEWWKLWTQSVLTGFLPKLLILLRPCISRLPELRAKSLEGGGDSCKVQITKIWPGGNYEP